MFGPVLHRNEQAAVVENTQQILELAVGTGTMPEKVTLKLRPDEHQVRKAFQVESEGVRA